jgi:hypothetical protein
MPLRYVDDAGRATSREKASYRLWAAYGSEVKSIILGVAPDMPPRSVAFLAGLLLEATGEAPSNG